VRAPTLANVQAVSHMLREQYLADMPIVIAAIDPCFSCTDRAIAVREAGEAKPGFMTWDQIRAFGIEWHRKRGVDFSRLNRTFRCGGGS